MSQELLHRIKKLNPHLVNQIAAGEVVERPAAILKELVENSLDAGALRIDVEVEDGGRALVAVHDNGSGIPYDDIPLAFERHATSKLSDQDLFAINTFGFRGEALPSIASISRTEIVTRTSEAEHAWKMTIENGVTSAISPYQASAGTSVEIRDIFYATPARLKFLKSATTELNHCKEMFNRIAMANPLVHFTFKSDGKIAFDLKKGSLTERVAQVMGNDFSKNTVPVFLQRQGYKLEGLISLPTYSKSQPSDQYIYVNNRWVRDRNVAGILRVAYQDVLMNGRHPMAVLFFGLDGREVDINVHPAKTEVRFRDLHFVRNFLIQGVKQSLQAAQHTSAPIMEDIIFGAFQTPQSPARNSFSGTKLNTNLSNKPILRDSYPSARPHPIAAFIKPSYGPSLELTSEPEATISDYPMGLAKTQLFETFIVAQTDDALLVVDQHAAHERVVYENLKAQWSSAGKLPSQPMLQPEYIELSETDCELFIENKDLFQEVGFIVDVYSSKTLVVHSTPISCHLNGSKEFIRDVLSDIKAIGEGVSAREVLWEKLASQACHNSIRAGKTLSLAEMNSLLRQMESTPKSAQCNHGRPTFVKLDKKSLEKLFER